MKIIAKISHRYIDSNDAWDVSGGRWSGLVVKLSHPTRLRCNCLQFNRYGNCWHIRKVIEELEKDKELRRVMKQLHHEAGK